MSFRDIDIKITEGSLRTVNRAQLEIVYNRLVEERAKYFTQLAASEPAVASDIVVVSAINAAVVYIAGIIAEEFTGEGIKEELLKLDIHDLFKLSTANAMDKLGITVEFKPKHGEGSDIFNFFNADISKCAPNEFFKAVFLQVGKCFGTKNSKTFFISSELEASHVFENITKEIVNKGLFYSTDALIKKKGEMIDSILEGKDLTAAIAEFTTYVNTEIDKISSGEYSGDDFINKDPVNLVTKSIKPFLPFNQEDIHVDIDAINQFIMQRVQELLPEHDTPPHDDDESKDSDDVATDRIKLIDSIIKEAIQKVSFENLKGKIANLYYPSLLDETHTLEDGFEELYARLIEERSKKYSRSEFAKTQSLVHSEIGTAIGNAMAILQPITEKATTEMLELATSEPELKKSMLAGIFNNKEEKLESTSKLTTVLIPIIGTVYGTQNSKIFFKAHADTPITVTKAGIIVDSPDLHSGATASDAVPPVAEDDALGVMGSSSDSDNE